MKKQKIILIILGVTCGILIAVAAVLNNKLDKQKEKVIELEYTQSKTKLELERYELKYTEQLIKANEYKSKYEYYEKRLEDIYVNAINDDNKSVIEFFTKGLYEIGFPDTTRRPIKSNKSEVNRLRLP